MKLVQGNNTLPKCSACILNELCLPIGMSKHDIALLDEFVTDRMRIPKNEFLYQHGDHAGAIYGLRSGALKTQIQEPTGKTQITGFVLPGEILGMDGIGTQTHVSQAIALEDSEVCVIKTNDIDKVAAQIPQLQQQFRRLMSLEINRSHKVLMTIGSLKSEQRLATFLLNISYRLSALGYSSSIFILRMSREEIANFLGLTLETISRLFTKLSRSNIIKIDKREVTILNKDALIATAGIDLSKTPMPK